MSTLLFANNARSFLAGPLTSSSTSCTLAAGTGTLFPLLAAGQYFKLTFTDASTNSVVEIVHVTSRTGDNLTIVRGQENTTPINWLAGDHADNLLTAGSLNNFLQQSQLSAPIYEGTDNSSSGSPNAVNVPSLVPAHPGIPVAGEIFLVQKNFTNTGAATFQIAGSSPIPIRYKDGADLAANDWPAASAALLYYNGSIIQFLASANSSANVLYIIQNVFLIKTAVTKTVYGPGADFIDLNAAFDWLSGYQITSYGSVTFQCAAGVFVHSTPLRLFHPNVNRVSIIGATPLGSFPAAIGLQGNGANSTNRATDAMANLVLMRAALATELRFNGITENGTALVNIQGMGHINNLLMTSDGSGTNMDFFHQGSGIAYMNNCAIHGASANGLTISNCTLNLSGFISTYHGSVGIFVSGGGVLVGAGGEISSLNNGGDGVIVTAASNFSNVGTTKFRSCGNNGNGFNADGNSFMTLDTIGWAEHDFGSGYLSQDSSCIQANTCISQNNFLFAFSANKMGYLTCANPTNSGNGAGFSSPALNTVGNNNSYINQ